MYLKTNMEKRFNILVIEDDAVDAELLEEYLRNVENFFFQMKVVPDLESLDSILTESAFDVILMDLGLRESKGIETYRRFKALNFNLPVILVTGLDDELIALEAINEGAQDYLVKGNFTGEITAQAIRYSIARFNIEERLRESNRELRRLKNNLENQVADTVRIMMEKDSMLISRSQQVLTGEMVSNIANQWKQPLNSLSMVIQAINDSYKYGDLTAEMLDKKTSLSIELINYLARTIDDFREYFEPRKQRQMFDISLLLEKTIGFIEYSLETDGIRLQLETERDCYAEGYPNEFSQAIINIVNNAREVIKYRAIPAEKRVIIIKTVCQNKISRITIEDKAGGIPESNLTKIFEPHFTTKAEKGTGVGLYMSKSIIEQKMNGRLGVENTNEGAKFIIEL